MSGSPIGADLENEQGYRGSEREKFDTTTAGYHPEREFDDTDARYPRDSTRNEVPSNSRMHGNDFLPDILDAQQRLISAQHQFLHDGDMRSLAKAQLALISFQSNVMQRMGVFG